MSCRYGGVIGHTKQKGAFCVPLVLSPAGSPEALYAALNAGADEIYFGLPSFNARENAKNFTMEDAREAIRSCKLVGTKTNITLNTLVSDRELDGALRLAYDAACMGADAFIVQDMGLARALKKAIPEITLHASTQCACHSYEGAKMLAESGFSRVVLARELDRNEIERIVSLGVETEVFVHGALCVCHSGLCLMSAVIGKRSGNRGLCAQPCRLPYTLSGQKASDTYPLSLKDLSLAKQVPLLNKLGITSLKIEGRMKPPSYVEGVTRVWKTLVAENRGATAQELDYLEALFSRSGFTDGYFTGSYRTDNRSMYGIRTEADKRKTDSLAEAEPSGKTVKKHPVCISACFEVGKAPEIAISDASDPSLCARVTADFVAQPASSAPVGRESIELSLMKLGTTSFVCTGIQIKLCGKLFLAKSQLNALRRQAVEALEEKILAFQKPTFAPERAALPVEGLPKRPAERPSLRLFPNTAEAVSKMLCEHAENDIESVCLPLSMFEPACKNTESVLTALREKNLIFGVRMPRVVFSAEEPAARKALQNAKACGAAYAVAENIGDLPLIAEAGLALFGGAALNVFNSQTIRYFAEKGMTDITLSPELTAPQMRDLQRPHGVKLSLVGAGRLELMVLESCVVRACSECKRSADGEICAFLTDRLGYRFPIRAAHRLGSSPYPCRNIVLNSVPLKLLDKPEELAKSGVQGVCVYENPEIE